MEDLKDIMLITLASICVMTFLILCHTDINDGIKADKEVRKYEIEMKYLGESKE